MKETMRFVSPLERALYLKTIPLFSRLASVEVAALAQYVRERFFRRGSTILRAGERAGAMYIVVEGSVLTSGGPHPEPTPHGPEESVGALSLLARDDAGVDAVAETDALTLEIDAELLLDMFDDHFGFLHEVIRTLAAEMLTVRMATPDGAYFGEEAPLVAPGSRRLDLVEKIVLLRQGPTFMRSNVETIAQVARSMREVRLEPGTVAWRAGDPADAIYLILSGTITCVLDGGARRFRCGAGYPLGNLEMLAGRPRWYDAVVETPTVALSGSSERFLDILEDNNEVAVEFVASMASGLMQALSLKARAVAATGGESAEAPVASPQSDRTTVP